MEIRQKYAFSGLLPKTGTGDAAFPAGLGNISMKIVNPIKV